MKPKDADQTGVPLAGGQGSARTAVVRVPQPGSTNGVGVGTKRSRVDVRRPAQTGSRSGSRMGSQMGSSMNSMDLPMEWMDPMRWRLPSGKALAEFALQAGFLAPLMLETPLVRREQKSGPKQTSRAAGSESEAGMLGSGSGETGSVGQVRNTR